jgi:penicillin amidase
MAVVAILAITLGIFAYTLKPDYDGEKQLSSLTENVEVYYDAYGVPHIYGKSNQDAFRALGYVHAQDRLWQMELLRRIGKGGLSEVFGKDVLSTDKFFLSLGIDEASAKTVSELDMNSEAVLLSQSYLDGINQFIEEGPTPLEFYLTGIEKTSFTLIDIHNTLGYMSFSFAQAHKTDPLLTRLKDKLGMEYLKDLEIDIDPSSTLIQNHNPKLSDSLPNTIISEVSKSLKSLHIPLFEGSNSWVLGPEKTKNGKVIFANDPHIGFSQPSVWFEAHVVTPTYEKYGYHLAGVPFPLLGHDRNLAYGMTMFENDDVDFYYEETNPSDSTQYKTNTGWEAFEIVERTIKVKDEEDVLFSFKKTKQGPVLNGIANQVSGKRPMSMWWAYTKNKNEVIEALFEMASATDIQAVEKALPKIHAPGLNIMYGDAKGNIAWWATAKLYEIPDGVHTKFVQENSSDFSRDRKYLPFPENPQAINPPWNYVYSANNQPDTINGQLYPGYYLPENRAKRIVELLAPKNDWDTASVSEMITDVTSAVDPTVLHNFLIALNIDEMHEKDSQVLDRLRSWKGDHPLESVEATIFHRWEFWVLQNTFMDELGFEDFESFLSTHMSKRVMAPMSKNPKSIWWDDISTKEVRETQAEIIHTAFDKAVSSLREDFGDDVNQWTWSKVHTLEHGHPIGQVEALRSFFNVGPFPVHGSREVINNLGFGYNSSGFYKVGSGPSTRRVIDFSDIENSMSILPTGQSGNPFSKYYKDQAEMFTNGKFRKMMMNKDAIIKNADSRLIFQPK